MALLSATSAMRFDSENTSPRVDSEIPVRRDLASKAARNSFAASGRARSACETGDDVDSLIAALIVAIVTRGRILALDPPPSAALDFSGCFLRPVRDGVSTAISVSESRSDILVGGWGCVWVL